MILETIKFKRDKGYPNEEYFVYDRLRQLRNVDNPHDVIKFDDILNPQNWEKVRIAIHKNIMKREKESALRYIDF